MFWGEIFNYTEIVLIYSFIFLLVFIFVSGCDDLFIDLYAFFNKIKPTQLSPDKLLKIFQIHEKKIALLIPAWDESQILENVLEGNQKSIYYKNFNIFVGIYPNDYKSIEILNKVQKKYPHIYGVINDQDGPTSKGQILNFVMNKIMIMEQNKESDKHEIFLFHDAEDSIHPFSLKIINWKNKIYDFIQLPVFPFQTSINNLVSGTYMDEFAETHTKDLLVRMKLNAGVPSAGVGTALSKKLVHYFLNHTESKSLFREDTVTEDYDLGIQSRFFEFKAAFLCYFFFTPDKKKEYICTREFFPKKFNKALRQKSRWSLGITLQGWKNLKWAKKTKSSIWINYFLWRDRKGVFTNPLSFFSLIFLFTSSFIFIFYDFNIFFQNKWIFVFVFLNLGLLFNRVLQKIRALKRVYHYKSIALIWIRLPLGIAINFFSTLKALHQQLQFTLYNKKINWDKTSHEVPLFNDSTLIKPGLLIQPHSISSSPPFEETSTQVRNTV